MIVFLALTAIGACYRTTLPAHVQAAITEARDAANIIQVRTVESISEGDASLAGRLYVVASEVRTASR